MTRSITWGFEPHSSYLGFNPNFLSIIVDALDGWSDLINVVFVQSATPEILMSFKPDSFLPNTNWAAAAYDIFRPGSLAGDLYFNQDAGSSSYSDVFLPYLVTHEIGHVLGLDHSDNYSSVMYSGYVPRPIHPEDIVKAQKIWGASDLVDQNAIGDLLELYNVFNGSIDSAGFLWWYKQPEVNSDDFIWAALGSFETTQEIIYNAYNDHLGRKASYLDVDYWIHEYADAREFFEAFTNTAESLAATNRAISEWDSLV